MIQIKRSVQSSIRDDGEKIIFSSFTIRLDGLAYEKFMIIFEKFGEEDTSEGFRRTLEKIIGVGLNEVKK